MMPSTVPNLYKHHRFPGEIISHAVWLYFRFPLSHRDVEELLLVRGVIVSYEAIRKWCRKFGQRYANQLRRRRPRPGDKWHLDEVFLTINQERHYLWRAVDEDGAVLDILVQRQRDKKAANPPASGSAGCRASSRQGTRSGFSPRTVLLPSTSDLVVIDYLPPSIVKKGARDAGYGRRSRAQRWRPEGTVSLHLAQFRPFVTSR
jgi:hypothetical protein